MAADRLAALKARVAAAVGTSKGGLNVGLHPALEDLGSVRPLGETRGKGESHSNPYLDATPASQGPVAKPRPSRSLQFNPKGKYIQQGNALRRQAALEAMKARIAEQTRKAGIDETPSEKNFVVDAPPEIEWFDEPYFPESKTYKDVDDARFLDMMVRLGGPDAVISNLIQHPVPIEPPGTKTEAKPLYMTKKEQKKLRRQRRMAIMKEMQAKQRLGLEPAPAPKVKKSNLMRLLGQEAVKDPTATEARVNMEIAQRHQKHVESNEERKLTKEQRHEKLLANREKDVAKGVHMVVFRINSLTDGKHRYKIAVNAEQLGLTGVCLLHRKTNLVIAEGGEWSIDKYKKLMLNRIDWTHGTPSNSTQDPERDWLKDEVVDMSTNRCQLIFEGEVKGRVFRKWSSKICDTDREAVEFLSRTKLETLWAQALNNP